MGTVVACSSTSATSSGVDPKKALDALSPAEVQSLCDWTAKAEGGYGNTVVCNAGGVPLEVPVDQANCVTDVTPHWGQRTCVAPVSDWMTCARWAFANVCATPALARPASCVAIDVDCFGGDDSVPRPDSGSD